MSMLSEVLHRYLAPFLTGASMAGTTVVQGAPTVLLLIVAALVFGYVSLPAGGRMLRRLAAEAES